MGSQAPVSNRAVAFPARLDHRLLADAVQGHERRHHLGDVGQLLDEQASGVPTLRRWVFCVFG
jgi:hypothetical protein